MAVGASVDSSPALEFALPQLERFVEIRARGAAFAATTAAVAPSTKEDSSPPSPSYAALSRSPKMRPVSSSPLSTSPRGRGSASPISFPSRFFLDQVRGLSIRSLLLLSERAEVLDSLFKTTLTGIALIIYFDALDAINFIDDVARVLFLHVRYDASLIVWSEAKLSASTKGPEFAERAAPRSPVEGFAALLQEGFWIDLTFILRHFLSHAGPPSRQEFGLEVRILLEQNFEAFKVHISRQLEIGAASVEAFVALVATGVADTPLGQALYPHQPTWRRVRSVTLLRVCALAAQLALLRLDMPPLVCNAWRAKRAGGLAPSRIASS